MIKFTAAEILNNDTGEVEVVLSEKSERQPRFREIIVDCTTGIGYITNIGYSYCDPPRFVIRCLSKDDISKIKIDDIINNEFIPYHLQGIPESYGTGTTTFSTTSSLNVPDSSKRITKYMLEILDRIKNSLGIKKGKEGNRD